MSSNTISMSTYKARIMAHNPANTTTFLRGDNVFTNTIVNNGSDATVIVEQKLSGSEHITSLMAGTSGNAGIWDYTHGKYLVYFTKSGVGYLNGNATTATTLQTARTIQTNLASTSAASFNGSVNITPGVTGVLPFGNGGTGATSGHDAIKNIANALTQADGDFTDDTVIITNNNSGDLNTWFRRKSTSMWNYINSKLTAEIIGGKVDSRYVNVTGDTMTGNLTLYNSGSGSTPQLIFKRVDNNDSYYDWRIYDSSGSLYFDYNTPNGWIMAFRSYEGITYGSFNGPLTGNVTGNCSGTSSNVTGTIAIGNGGTGATTANNALANFANNLTLATAEFTDSTVLFSSNNDGTLGTWYRRNASSMWAYIAGKGDPRWINASGDTMTGALIHSSGHVYLAGAAEYSSVQNTTQLVFGTPSNNHVCVSSNVHCLIINPTVGSTANQIDLYLDTYSIFPSGVKNAVWNDFAEFRCVDINDPGRVVIPTKNKVATKSTARLQFGGRVISDTYGVATGESDQAKTPLGMAGRVLVHVYRNISEYHLGDCVCTAPNGTVDIMTREEIMMYPDRIIGIVNEIPDYEEWTQTYTNKDGGKTIKTVVVNGRIWIDIK